MKESILRHVRGLTIHFDERAQSYTYIIALGSLILFAAVYSLFYGIVEQILEEAEANAQTEYSMIMVQNANDIWTWLPLLALMLVLFLVIASSVYSSRRGV